MTEAEREGSRPAAKRIAGRYEVLGRIGSGPHGPTYLALDHRRIDATREEREVALKILRTPLAEAPDFDLRLRTLVQRLDGLAGDVLVVPLDNGRTELGLPYLSLELVHGTSLEQVLATEGPLAEGEARALIRRLGEALQAVHDRGLVHGALDPHQVLLVGPEREPRVMDVGLAALLAEGPAPVERDDVRALGRLLAATLSGDVTGETPPRDPELRRVVETALAGEGFQETSAIVAALSVTPDDTKAPEEAEARGPAVLVRPGPSRKPLVLVALLFGVAAAAAAWSARGNVTAAREREALAKEEEHARLERRLEKEAQRAERLAHELEATRTELAGRTEGEPQLAERVGELSSELTETREESDTLRKERDDAERTLADTERERAVASARSAALQAERDDAQAELEALRKRERERRKEADATALFAQDLGARIATADPRNVWSFLRSPVAQDVLPHGAESPLLDAWTRAADLLERSAAATPDAMGPLLEEAAAAVEETRVAETAFVAELRARLGKNPALEKALDDVLTALGDGLEERRAARDAARRREWKGRLAAPLDATPARALALAEELGGGHRDELLDAVAAGLGERFAAGGELDLEALSGEAPLGPWAEALAAAPELTGHGGACTVLRYAWAQLWYGDGDASAALAGWPLPGARGESAAMRSLRLELELFRPGGPFPGPPGRRALYRSQTADGHVTWQIETVQPDDGPPEGAIRSWRILQRFYDGEGRYKSERTLRIAQHDRAIVEEGVRRRTILRRASEPRATTGWSPPSDAPPFRLPIHPDAIATFQERLMRGPVDTLVEEEDGAIDLWAPGLGLVRHADPALVTRELFYADPAGR